METIFQSKEWEELKLKTGYQKSHWVDGILVLQKNLPLGRSLLYSPMVSQSRMQKVESRTFLEQIKKISHENGSIFYRLELDIPSTLYALPSTLGFIKAFEQMQPENTWVLDLNKSEEELLAQMSMRCRYNVRLAEKSGVEIKSDISNKKMLDDFYKLYLLTGKRHGITFRSQLYFQNFLEILGRDGYARIYTTSFTDNNKNKVLSSGIVVYSGQKAIYMFGASSNELRNLKAPNLMVWQMMLDAKKASCKEFDFYGIAPTEDPGHPWAGITSFKKQFGGQQVDILGSYDLIFKPVEYRIFKTLEKIRR